MSTTSVPNTGRWWPFARRSAVRRAPDLVPDLFPAVSWGENAGEGLEQLRTYVIGEAKQASNWYLQRRIWKRRGAQITRVGAIVAVTLAGLIPVLMQLFGTDGKFAFNPGWGTVALAAAALLVALDYFYGYTSSWIRYLDAEQKIARIIYEFQFDWERLRTGWAGRTPDPDQVAVALSQLRTAVLRVQQVVEYETSLWAAEFRSTLKHFDDAARSHPPPSARAGANVIVTNGSALTAGWRLTVGDGPTEPHNGNRAALTNLKPGPCKFAAEGELEGRPVRDEATVEIPEQGVVEVSLTLQ